MLVAILRNYIQIALIPTISACLISMTATTHLPCSEFSPAHTLLEELQLPELAAGREGGESQPEGKSACGSLNRSPGATGRASEEGRESRILERDVVARVIFNILIISVFM